MPDLHLTIEDMIADGDKVMCRSIWRWTDTASGKKMQFHGFVLWRFEGDKIAERWATVTQPAEGARVDKELMRFQGGCDDTRYWSFWQRGCCRTNRVSVRPLLRVRVV
jgi:hypothetical protein